MGLVVVVFWLLIFIFVSYKGNKNKDNRSMRRLKLQSAAIKGDLPLVKSLIDKGVDINTKNNNGWTPLYYAAVNGQKETVEYLLSKGVDINVKDNDGWTPLHCAASTSKKPLDDDTELYKLIRAGKQEEAKQLILSGKVDLNAKGVDGKTLLDLAIELKQGIVSLYIQKNL